MNNGTRTCGNCCFFKQSQNNSGYCLMKSKKKGYELANFNDEAVKLNCKNHLYKETK